MVAQQTCRSTNHFLNDVFTLRETAQRLMAPPDGQGAETSVALLQTVLSTELVCVRRYTSISVSAAGLRNARVGAEFQEQANDERRHMTMVAQRITELGGTPDFSPADLIARTAMIADDESSLTNAVQQNLAAEQGVVAHYRDLIAYFGNSDPATGAIMENILLDEENHVTDMLDLLSGDNRARH